jgi:hypothetical protein
MSKRSIYLVSFVLVLALILNSTTGAALVGWWKLDEGSGNTANDSSGYEHHGIIGGEPNWIIGPVGGAMEFDGATNYIDVDGDIVTGTMSVAMWVLARNIPKPNHMAIIHNDVWESGTIHVHLLSTSAHVKFDSNGGTAIETETSLEADQWYHITYTYDSTTGEAQMFVNGVWDVTIEGSPMDLYLGTLNFGAWQNSSRHYEGAMDDIRIYDHILSEDEILYVMAGMGKAVAKGSALSPNPRHDVVDVARDVNLSWKAGLYADKHDVYLGTDVNDVNDADVNDTTGIYRGRQDLDNTSYIPTELPLDWAQTYYWRIDEVNEAEPNSPWKGVIWSFTVTNHIVVEDFEDYNDYSPDQIFSTWLDGYEVPTNGALVGHDADFSKGEHIVETTIAHGGKQSMPYYYNNIGAATYSEAERAFSPAQDWTREGVGVLSLWFRGHPAYMGSFIEGPTGTYTMTAEGTDIWSNSDEFHFAWKELSGAGSIVAKVDSVSDTDPWAKAGVMIRDTLEPGSRHAMVVVTPGNGVAFQYRNNADSISSTAAEETGISAPQWVKVERTVGGLVRGYYSADGNTWTQLGTPQTVTMNTPTYVGLALTSHNSGVACEAKFSNITSDGTGQWVDEDIGMLSNEAEPMYLTVKDGSGTAATVYYDDPDAPLINTWTEWRIDLKEFGDAGVVLTDVSNLAIGFGGADDAQPGGSGLVFFDDIRLYMPAEQTP